jgi:hypothetical protein
MKRIGIGVLLTLLLAFVPALFGQDYDHGEVGVDAEDFMFGALDNNMVGLNGRAAFNVHKYVQIEANMGWDFERAFNEFCTDCVPPVTTARSKFRILHAEFGPKFNFTTHHAVRPYLVLKGGFTNFSFSTRPGTFGTFTSSVDRLRTDNVSAVFYPGGGLEFFAGPFGLRFEIGDEMYFNNGAQNNLLIKAGPTIRF